jgi:hypothetical protein
MSVTLNTKLPGITGGGYAIVQFSTEWQIAYTQDNYPEQPKGQ